MIPLDFGPVIRYNVYYQRHYYHINLPMKVKPLNLPMKVKP